MQNFKQMVFVKFLIRNGPAWEGKSSDPERRLGPVMGILTSSVSDAYGNSRLLYNIIAIFYIHLKN